MSWGSHLNRFRRINPRKEEDYTDEFIDQVIALWDQKVDTFEIAQALYQSQAACERALHIGLERRRQITWLGGTEDQAQDASTEVRSVPHEPD